ncbi:MAG: DUF3459 domain-containing protein [Rhizobiales bacterium]|nr:DUF3459 domain-containing protein [Hyphomicrobiales bacterium]
MRAEVIGAETLAVHRWRGEQHRLLIANFGPSLGIDAADPALARMPRGGAELLLSTAAHRYGGQGGRPGMKGRGAARQLEIPARAAVLFAWDTPAEPTAID